MTFSIPPLASNSLRFLPLTLGVVVLGLIGSGCRQLSSRPVVVTETPGSIGQAASFGREEFLRSWDVFGTDDGHVACLTYMEITASHPGFTVKCGGGTDKWIEIGGYRPDLRKGECLLVTNGPHGEVMEINVPWMRVTDVLGPPGPEKQEKDLEGIQKLCSPMLPRGGCF